MIVSQENLDNCLVVSFARGERTERLNDLCFKNLGFKNRITLSGDSGFHEKFLEFAEIASESKFDFFIRNDADCLVFYGILDLLKMVIDNPDISWATGKFYDYLMNRSRVGTPSVHRRDCLEYLNANRHLMSDVQKPESTFARSIQHMFTLKDVDILTNLHEYEQFPSKVCNSFLNRIYRNHYPQLYDIKHLNSIPDHYKKAVNHAFDFCKKHGFKDSMVHRDFKFLDEGFEPLTEQDLQSKYLEYYNLYKKIKEGVK